MPQVLTIHFLEINFHSENKSHRLVISCAENCFAQKCRKYIDGKFITWVLWWNDSLSIFLFDSTAAFYKPCGVLSYIHLWQIYCYYISNNIFLWLMFPVSFPYDPSEIDKTFQPLHELLTLHWIHSRASILYLNKSSANNSRQINHLSSIRYLQNLDIHVIWGVLPITKTYIVWRRWRQEFR